MFNSLPDKRDDFNFAIINFQHLYGNIPTAPRMELLFVNSYATLEPAVCIQTFYNVTVYSEY
jgi:hypothetical protein